MLASFAEFERKIINERTQAGREVAKANGRYKNCGSKRIEVDIVKFEKHYPAYKNGDFSAQDFARMLSMSRHTFYRRLREYEDGLQIGADVAEVKQ